MKKSDDIITEPENEGADSETTAEQSQETIQPAVRVSREDLEGVHRAANGLVQELARVPDGDLVGEIVVNALKLLRDQTNRGDIKLINKSYKELRYALKIFAPYRDTRKISIFGSARTPETHEDYKHAARFGKIMADAGWMAWRFACRSSRPPTRSSPTIPSSSTSNISSRASSCSSAPATRSPCSPAGLERWMKALKCSRSSRPANPCPCRSCSAIAKADASGTRGS
jgi:hypothetical protein